MYTVKYEVKVLFKNLSGCSVGPTLFTEKSIPSPLYHNKELGDYKHMVLSVSSAMFYFFVNSDSNYNLF